MAEARVHGVDNYVRTSEISECGSVENVDGYTQPIDKIKKSNQEIQSCEKSSNVEDVPFVSAYLILGTNSSFS